MVQMYKMLLLVYAFDYLFELLLCTLRLTLNHQDNQLHSQLRMRRYFRYSPYILVSIIIPIKFYSLHSTERVLSAKFANLKNTFFFLFYS